MNIPKIQKLIRENNLSLEEANRLYQDIYEFYSKGEIDYSDELIQNKREILIIDLLIESIEDDCEMDRLIYYTNCEHCCEIYVLECHWDISIGEILECDSCSKPFWLNDIILEFGAQLNKKIIWKSPYVS